MSAEHWYPTIHIDPMLAGRLDGDETAAGILLDRQGQPVGDIRHIHLTTDAKAYMLANEGAIDYDLGHHVVIGDIDTFMRAKIPSAMAERMANLHVIFALADYAPDNEVAASREQA